MTKKLTVLVTGGAGFIGSHLCEKLLQLGYKVIALDNFQTGRTENLIKCTSNKDFLLIKGNVNHQNYLRPLIRFPIDYIYHYAACVGVQRTLSQPLEVLDDIDGIKNILDLAREKQVKRFFYSSSSEVYGESVSFPQNENSTPLNSKLPYAAVKNLGEIYIRTFQKEYGLPYTIFRFFNTYGPRQSKEFVISKFITQSLADLPITIYGDGSQTRSFINIRDNITATTRALNSKGSLNTTINIGNPKEITILNLAREIITLTKSKSSITHLPKLPEGDMPRRIPDIHLMKTALNTIPQVSFKQGLSETIKYLKNE